MKKFKYLFYCPIKNKIVLSTIKGPKDATFVGNDNQYVYIGEL